MYSNKRNQNILILLTNRERGTKTSPYRTSLHILDKLIHSKDSNYQQVWNKKSNSAIMYEAGHFYFNNYTTCYALLGHNCKPSLIHYLNPKNAAGKILDVATYTTPVYKIILQDNSGTQNISLSRYLICITKDSWLCQYHWDSGNLMKEIYVKPYGEKITFMHCDWNEYSKQIILTSSLNPKGTKTYHDDVVVVLAVFNAYPFEFCVMFEIKRSVFGKNLRHVNVSDQMLILGMGQQGVHMYNFEEVINGGTFYPHKIDDLRNLRVNVGRYPDGIPYNVSVDSAPPLLFTVQGYDQSINVGGYPFHYIYSKKYEDTYYIVKKLTETNAAKNGFIKSNIWLSDNGFAVTFHPDGSNRIIHKTAQYVHCYKIINDVETSELKKVYTMGFPEQNEKSSPKYSAYGRKLTTRKLILGWYDRYVLATDYEDELDLFGILGIFPGDPTNTGFVKLYNSLTGTEIKCINLEKTLSDTNRYELHIDLDSIIVMERDLSSNFYVFLYQLCS